jgi:myo-inositol-1(or 4)-monophosphatase
VSTPEASEPAAENSTEVAELLGVALQCARMAGELLLDRFERGVAEDVRSKSTPTDLVSEADFAAQRAIQELLAELRPGDGFLGEEGGDDVDADTAGGIGGHRELRWVVDPLDGTVNYLFGIPQWCVSVAVQDGDAGTVAGAIFDPNRDEMWAATRDGAATLNGAAVSASERSELSSAMVATGLYYDAGVRAEQGRVLAQLVPRVRDIRRMGSAALDMTWTAAGRYDAYFERGTKLWDVAAGALICERAGLRVVDLAEHDRLPTGLLVAPVALVDPLLELVG